MIGSLMSCITVVSRIQGRERILEYHLHLLTQRTHLLAAVVCDVLTVKQDLASRRL